MNIILRGPKLANKLMKPEQSKIKILRFWVNLPLKETNKFSKDFTHPGFFIKITLKQIQMKLSKNKIS
jgi:hypothetical protein